jgi:hypothetical protein
MDQGAFAAGGADGAGGQQGGRDAGAEHRSPRRQAAPPVHGGYASAIEETMRPTTP